jgi:hypothetical protein
MALHAIRVPGERCFTFGLKEWERNLNQLAALLRASKIVSSLIYFQGLGGTKASIDLAINRYLAESRWIPFTT